MKKFTKNILQIATGFGTAVTLCAGKAMSVLAAPTAVEEGANAARGDGMPANLVGADGIINKVTDILLYVVGFIAVLMLIWGGVRYIISGGDSKKITDAKNTILYALLGLVIAFISYAIVHYILSLITPTASDDPEVTSAIIQYLSHLA